MTNTETSTTREISLRWDSGTAYEFFVSLHVLHHPDKYGIRASWAAGIRSRIPAVERKFLDEIAPFLWVPFQWLHTHPAPKDAHNMLRALEQLPAERRFIELMGLETWEKQEGKILLEVTQTGSWSDAEFAQLEKKFCKGEHTQSPEALRNFLSWLSRPAEAGEALLMALQAYQQAFFEEEEKRVRPVLETGLARAQALATTLRLDDLITELSQGIHLGEPIQAETLTFIPAYWTTPLMIFADLDKTHSIFMFGARPVDMSAIPGELVPEGLLRTLKALADPTRLKILHYLARETVTPSELARRLHLRAPTVTHHLSELRLSGLVNLTLKGQEKLYSLRTEALESTFETLKHFLEDSEVVE